MKKTSKRKVGFYKKHKKLLLVLFLVSILAVIVLFVASIFSHAGRLMVDKLGYVKNIPELKHSSFNRLDYVVSPDDPQFYFDSDTSRWYMDALGFEINSEEYRGNNNGTPFDGHNLIWFEGGEARTQYIESGSATQLDAYFNSQNSFSEDIIGLATRITFMDISANMLIACKGSERDNLLSKFEQVGVVFNSIIEFTVFNYNGDGTFSYVVEEGATWTIDRVGFSYNGNDYRGTNVDLTGPEDGHSFVFSRNSMNPKNLRVYEDGQKLDLSEIKNSLGDSDIYAILADVRKIIPNSYVTFTVRFSEMDEFLGTLEEMEVRPVIPPFKIWEAKGMTSDYEWVFEPFSYGKPSNPPPSYSPILKPSEPKEISEKTLTEKETSILEELLNKLENLEKRVANLEKDLVVERKAPEITETVVPINQNIYTVQPKDYLYLIAQKVYGNSNRWYDLINLNKARYPTIANPPHELKIGWELRY